MKWQDVRTSRKKSLFAGGIFLLLIFLFTSVWVVQFVILFFFLVVILSRLYSVYLIKSLAAERRDGELRAFRNEWLTSEIWVENRGRLPAYMVAVNDNPGALAVFRGNKAVYALPGRTRRVFRWQAYCSSRGVYSLGPLVLRAADPLGLFPFTLKAAETSRLFVYPAPALIAVKPPGGVALGSLLSSNPFHEDLTRRRSLRQYYPGDELRRINWKATARSGGGEEGMMLMVNEYDATLSYPMMIFLNADPLEYPLKFRELYWERAIEAAAALCLMANRERQNLGFEIYTGGKEGGETIEPAASALIPILERLAALRRPETSSAGDRAGPAEGKISGSSERLLEIGKKLSFGTRLVYVGANLGDACYRALDSLKKRRLTLEYLVIDERKLSPFAPVKNRRYQMKEAGYEVL